MGDALMRYTPAMDGGIIIVWAAVLGGLYVASRYDALPAVWLTAIGAITLSGVVGLLSAL